jgi:hypothetical protein
MNYFKQEISYTYFSITDTAVFIVHSSLPINRARIWMKKDMIEYEHHHKLKHLDSYENDAIFYLFISIGIR